jgi:hypothetical protein
VAPIFRTRSRNDLVLTPWAIADGAAPAGLTNTILAKALPYSWAQKEQRFAPAQPWARDPKAMDPGLSEAIEIFETGRDTIERAASNKYDPTSRRPFEVVTVTTDDLSLDDA